MVQQQAYPRDVADVLTAPGGGAALRAQPGGWMSQAGQHFRVEQGIVRMLEVVDPGLAAELEAQRAACDIYLDEHQLMTLYERHVVERVREQLWDLPIGARVLDAGCGIGLIGRLIPSLNLYGLDACFELLTHATAGYRLRIECTATTLPFANASFDAVLAVNMLHHVVEPAHAVSEFVRVLRPGGLLVGVDPRSVAPIEWAKRVLRRGDAAYAPTHRAFATDEYRELLGAGGALSIEDFKTFGMFALIAAGGLDATRLSAKLPGGRRILSGLQRVDDLLSRAPFVRDGGFNFVVRARRNPRP